MQTPIAIIIAGALIAGAIVASNNRYAITSTHSDNFAFVFRVDQLTGDVTYCDVTASGCKAVPWSPLP